MRPTRAIHLINPAFVFHIFEKWIVHLIPAICKKDYFHQSRHICEKLFPSRQRNVLSKYCSPELSTVYRWCFLHFQLAFQECLHWRGWCWWRVSFSTFSISCTMYSGNWRDYSKISQNVVSEYVSLFHVESTYSCVLSCDSFVCNFVFSFLQVCV